MRIAIITAGAAGMICGSCLKDNTLARALIARGHDCRLIPTYTPLTLDEADESTAPIYLGGVNVFLDEYRWSRWLPGFARRWLDSPTFLRFVTRFANSGDYRELGDLTISMLRGESGRQSRHVVELAEHLARDFQPDAVVLSNVLLSGLVPAIKKRLDVPIWTTVQGDDLFLEQLETGHRTAALELIRENHRDAAGIIATSAAYADRMAEYLGLPRTAFRLVRPGIRVENFQPVRKKDETLTIGYFARIAPEKGLQRLIAALRSASLPPFRLRVSGWLGASHHNYLNQCLAEFRRSFGDQVEYVPCPTLADKVQFLQSLDIFSVPAVFHEPKGIYALEAMACGVPVVQPDAGAFPEMLKCTGGGLLVAPDNDVALANGIAQLANSTALRRELGERGRTGVREHFSDEAMAHETEKVITSRLR